MGLYLWADPHFNHRKIISLTNREFKTVQEMNSCLIELWNSRVKKNSDIVWLLGDFGFHAPNSEGTTDLGKIFWQLNGTKNLIIGNHDEKNTQVMRLPWNDIQVIKNLRYDGNRAVLCHYPMDSWLGAWRGTMMFHGHCHGTLTTWRPKRYDVGFDTGLGSRGPIPWDHLVALAAKEKFVPVDGHAKTDM